MEERENAVEIRLLASRRQLAQAREELAVAEREAVRRVAEVEHNALQSVHAAAANAEDAAADRAFRRTIRGSDPAAAYHALNISLEEEQMLLQRELLRRMRREGGTGAIPIDHGGAYRIQVVPIDHGGTDRLEVDIDAREIERVALRGVMETQALPPAEREAGWQAWSRQLSASFPAYAVAEIMQRAQALRELL